MSCDPYIPIPAGAIGSGSSSDVSTAVILAPGSSTRNRVEPTGNFIPFTIRGFDGQTAKLFFLERQDLGVTSTVLDIGTDGLQDWRLRNGLGVVLGRILWATPGGNPGAYLTGPNGTSDNGYFFLFNQSNQSFEICHTSELQSRVVIGKDSGVPIGVVTIYGNNNRPGIVIKQIASPTQSALQILSSTDSLLFECSPIGNLGIGSDDYAGGIGVISLVEVVTEPAGTPSGAAVLWLGSDGFLHYKNAAGVTVDLDPSGSHDHSGTDIAPRHISGSGSTPTGSVDTGAGVGATMTITGTDLAGRIELITGTGPTAVNTIVCSITFATAFASAPRVVILTPATTAAAVQGGTDGVYVNAAEITTTGFVIRNPNSALSGPTTTYRWYYLVVG